MKKVSLNIKRLDEHIPDLDRKCRALLSETGTPGASINIYADGSHYGLYTGNASSQRPSPVTEHTAFNIGSCSKAFVSALIAAFCEDGRMKWSDPIAKYVPEFQLFDPELTQSITIEDLCANRTGIPREGFCEYGFHPEISAERILHALQYTKPLYPPRIQFTYLNPGHVASAIAAGRAGGNNFLHALKTRLLKPLDMRQTSGGANAQHDLDQIASWHVKRNGKNVEVPALYTDQYIGSGGVVMSGEDAFKWLHFQLTGKNLCGERILEKKALTNTHKKKIIATPQGHMATLFCPTSPEAHYCLGWATSLFEGERIICHSGSDIGVTSFTMLAPEKKFGVAVFVNVNHRVSIPLGYMIAGAFLNLPERNWRTVFSHVLDNHAPQHFSPSPLSQVIDYAGKYRHPADGTAHITRLKKRLNLHLSDGYKMDFDLTPISETRFLASSPHAEVQSLIEMNGPLIIEFDIESEKAKSFSLNIAENPRVFSRGVEEFTTSRDAK